MVYCCLFSKAFSLYSEFIICLIFYFVNVVNSNVLVCLCSYSRLPSVSNYKEEFILTVLEVGVFKIKVPALLVHTYVVGGGRARETQATLTSPFFTHEGGALITCMPLLAYYNWLQWGYIIYITLYIIYTIYHIYNKF